MFRWSFFINEQLLKFYPKSVSSFGIIIMKKNEKNFWAMPEKTSSFLSHEITAVLSTNSKLHFTHKWLYFIKQGLRWPLCILDNAIHTYVQRLIPLLLRAVGPSLGLGKVIQGPFDSFMHIISIITHKRKNLDIKYSFTEVMPQVEINS